MSGKGDNTLDTLRVTFIPGDGIGPEVARAARQVIDHVCPDIEWVDVCAGQEAFERYGDPVPKHVLEALEATGLGLKGPMGNTLQGYTSPNIKIRTEMGLWCNVRRAVHFQGSPSPHAGTDIVIIRDVTEDIGKGAQQAVGEDAGIAIKFTTRSASERIARFAMTYAREQSLRRITVPNQAAIHRTTDGLYLRAVLDVAEDFPDLRVDEEAMDALCMHLAMRPAEYQVLLCPNFYGGVLAGLCSGLVGGVGLMPGVNLDGAGRAVFEPGHGSAPKYAGLNKVDPAAMILSGAMLLEHVGKKQAADLVWRGVAEVIARGVSVTYDLGGSASTSEMSDAIRFAVDQMAGGS